MEARIAFGRPAFSRGTMATVAVVLAALVLGVTGGVIAKTVSLPAVAAPAHVLAGQPGASGIGSAWNYTSRHAGNKSVEGPAAAAAAPGKSFRAPATGRGGPQE